jgi:Tfp pilus assembly protein PilE
MRGLSLVDILVILAVVAVLLFAGSKDFRRYASFTVAPAPTATPSPSS